MLAAMNAMASLLAPLVVALGTPGGQNAPEDAWSPLPAEDWTLAAARHLLDRAGFGGTPEEPGPRLEGPNLAVLDDGDHLFVSSEGEELRFLLAAGKPLGEPVARGGPFVMNTRAEIEQAYRDYRDGTFLKKK